MDGIDRYNQIKAKIKEEEVEEETSYLIPYAIENALTHTDTHTATSKSCLQIHRPTIHLLVLTAQDSIQTQLGSSVSPQTDN